MSACSGRNYNFRCINVFFWRVLLESARTATKRRTNPSANSGKAATHVQIHMGMDILQQNCPSRHKGALGGFRGSTIQKFGEAVRLAPTLVHVCGFIWEWTLGNYKSPLNAPGGIWGGGGGVGYCVTNSKVLGSCQTAAPIGTKFGTRRRIRPGMDICYIQFAPKYPWGISGGGGVGGQKFKCLGSCQTAGPIGTKFSTNLRIRLAGNRHRLNTIRPSIPHGVLGGHKFKKSWEAVKPLDRLAPSLVHVCGFFWEWT